MKTPEKGLKVLEVFSKFESRFKRVSVRDQAILASDKVIMFLRVVDAQDRNDLGMLLEDVTMASGLTNDWENVRISIAQFTKRRE